MHKTRNSIPTILTCIAAVLFVAACFQPKQVPEGTECTPGEKRCQTGSKFGVEICKPDGTGWENFKSCTETERCDKGLCKPVPYCGNQACNLMQNENCKICPEDCGECCGNHVCDRQFDETIENCPQDCATDAGSPDAEVLSDSGSACTNVFFDDFNDDDISDWQEQSLFLLSNTAMMNKVPVASGGVYLHEQTAAIGFGGHHHALPPFQASAFEIRAKVRAQLTPQLNSNVGIFVNDQMESCDGATATCGHGYLCRWSPGEKLASGVGAAGKVSITLVDGATRTVLAQAELEDAQADEEWHDLVCAHKVNGTWEILLDGEKLQLEINTADSTFSSFGFVSTFIRAESTLFALDDVAIADCF